MPSCARSTTCEHTWRLTLEECRKTLGDDDYNLIIGYESPQHLIETIQELEKEYAKGMVPKLLKGIKPQLGPMQNFVTMVIIGTGSSRISGACMWGATTLLIQLASQSEKALGEIEAYLKDLGNKLRVFEIYNKALELDAEILEGFFELLVELVLCSVAAIKHFRRNDIANAVTIFTWTSVNNKFKKTIQDLASKLDFLQKMVDAQNAAFSRTTQAFLAQSLSQLTMSNTEVNMTCITLPFHRNSAFFGRSEILEDIDDVLKPPSFPNNSSVRSVALWGTGGIGKSQIALEYANLKLQAGLKVVIWIATETQEELSRSFLAAAIQLQLPGFSRDNTLDQNRIDVLHWLQRTSVPWLVIFDNVEDNDLLLQNWPVAGNGSILVTCRSELLAASPAAHALEVPSFTITESTDLLLQLLGKQKPDEEEAKAFINLAERLGGLALFLDLVAKQIRRRKQNAKNFLSDFNQHGKTLLKRPKKGISDPYYSKDIDTVWDTAFVNLSENAANLISLLCFMAPDGIPQGLLSPKHKIEGCWPFLSDFEGFDDAKTELLYLSLVRITEDSGLISIHRLTQTAYLDHLSEERRSSTFEVAWRLICHAFPKRADAGQHLFQQWQACEQLIQHVLALQEGYELLRKQNLSVQDDKFTRLMCDAAWYLAESGSFKRGVTVVTRAADNCINKSSLAYAHLMHSAGSLEHRRGRYLQAYEHFSSVLNIRKALAKPGSNDMANAYNGMTMGSTGLYKERDAIEYADSCLAVFEDKSEEEKLRGKYNVDRFLRNRGRAKYFLGLYDESKKDVEEAEKWETLIYGPASHYHGESQYDFGKIAMKKGDFTTAMMHLHNAYNYLSPGKPTHQSVMAVRWYQGLVSMQMEGDREQNDQKSLGYFKECLKICQLNEEKRGDQGESARVKYKISLILERTGKFDEAKTYRDAAISTKLSLEKTGFYPTIRDEERSWDSFLAQVYR